MPVCCELRAHDTPPADVHIRRAAVLESFISVPLLYNLTHGFTLSVHDVTDMLNIPSDLTGSGARVLVNGC